MAEHVTVTAAPTATSSLSGILVSVTIGKTKLFNKNDAISYM